MSRIARSSLTRLDLSGGGGGRTMEYILAGSLALIIVGSITVAVWTSLGGGSRGNAAAGQMMYKCDKCGEEYALDPAELGDPEQMEMYGDMGMLPRDCPKCGAEKSAYLMVKCPECGKYYVPDSHRHMAEAMMNPNAPPPPEHTRDICPHCNTDRIQWYREHRRKR